MSETARGDLADNTALRKVTKRVPLGQADHGARFLIETAGEGGCF